MVRPKFSGPAADQLNRRLGVGHRRPSFNKSSGVSDARCGVRSSAFYCTSAFRSLCGRDCWLNSLPLFIVLQLRLTGFSMPWLRKAASPPSAAHALTSVSNTAQRYRTLHVALQEPPPPAWLPFSGSFSGSLQKLFGHLVHIHHLHTVYLPELKCCNYCKQPAVNGGILKSHRVAYARQSMPHLLEDSTNKTIPNADVLSLTFYTHE